MKSKTIDHSFSVQTASTEEPLVPPYFGPYDIPVLLDDIKRLDDFSMARFSFFTIEAASAVDDWVALLRVRRIPFLLLGVSAVLHRPDLEVTHFTAPEQIDQLFDAIESVEGLVVETSHIWLPNFLFEERHDWVLSAGRENPATRRGAVWRISFGLFQRALQFQRETISPKRFVEECRELTAAAKAPAIHSPEETHAFLLWSQAQIEAARVNYAEQRDDPRRGVLQWLDKTGRIHAG